MKLVIGLTSKMELLAPAGDYDALRAAVVAGADAVYLGGRLFNARQSATNFDRDGLQAAVDLLHLHQKKLYVTVNTLINDSEMGQALDYLGELYNLGVDAVIVQDLGLIGLARQYLRDLELHASTQMTVHNSEGALFLKRLGVKRVVLARELTREEVERIVTTTRMEIEVFVHGALCVCYSGQCLFSSMVGGRSGNRGRCAQPCRMEYRWLQNGQNRPTKGAYLLSPKDLELVTLIPELDRAGVTSLKIEGRMKRPEYVHTVVSVYRRALERYYEAPDQFQVGPKLLNELEEAFNRGFSTGYFGNNRNAALMNWKRPNNRGVLLGRVRTVDPHTGKVGLKLEADLEVDDQVEVWVSQGGRGTTAIKEMWQQGRLVTTADAGSEVEFVVGANIDSLKLSSQSCARRSRGQDVRIYPGDRVFKIFSNRLFQQTRQALERNNPILQLGCTVTVRGREGKPLKVNYRDQFGNAVTVTSLAKVEAARQKTLTTELLQDHLGRLGNTFYYLKELHNELPPGLMVPLGELNRVRRNAIEQLQQLSLLPYQRPSVLIDVGAVLAGLPRREPQASNPPQLSVWVGDLESVRAAAQSGASLVYVGGDELTAFRWTEDHLRAAVRLAHEHGARLVMAMPRLNPEGQSDLWSYYYNLLTDLAEDGIIVSDLGLVNLSLPKAKRPLYLNYPLNFFNSNALQLLSDPVIKQIAVSPELTLKQIAALRPPGNGAQLEAVVHGPLELMVSEYCPISALQEESKGCQKLCKNGQYALQDRLNLAFPVYTDQFCRMHLFNSKDHCLYGVLDQIMHCGLAMLRLELKIYPADLVRRITGAYHRRLAQLAVGAVPESSDPLIEEWQRLTGRGITKGHYFRGVE
jgi:putative protease